MKPRPRARRRLARLRAVLLAFMAPGVGWPGAASAQAPESQAATPTAPAAAPTPAASEPAATPVTPVRYQVDIQAPAALATLLRTHLDLARFEQAAGPEGITSGELDRLIAATPEQARALLRTAGYFTATVKAERQPGPSPKVRITVEPGPLTRVAFWNLVPAGEFERLRSEGDADTAATWVALLSGWPLRPGDAFTQEGWSATKTSVLTVLRSRGYPQARLTDTRAEVDTAGASAGLRIEADSGPLYRLGAVRIEGLQHLPESTVRNMVDFGSGTPYSEKRLLDLQERLSRIGLFEGVGVSLEPDDDGDAVADVRVRVREAPRQQYTLGAGVSANTGPRVTVEQVHRRPFGLDLSTRTQVQWGRDERLAAFEGRSYPLAGQYRALLSGQWQWLDAGSALQWSRQVRAGLALDTERIERLIYGELVEAEVRTASGTSSASALSGNYNLVWRRLDSVLLPTLGETANMQAGAGWALSNQGRNGPFARAYGRFTAYRPVGERWYFTGRLELGQVFAPEARVIPDTLLFRAGGDDSVRGYAYRSLGPVDAAGVVRSGRVLGTVSVEMARPFSDRVPALWGAAFVDAGDATDTWRAWRPALGVGVGLRWRSPVGPLRVDLAYGEQVRAVRLHVSMGIAF